MIKYTLRCGGDHEFQSWFGSIAAYETLAKAGQLSCPVCGSSKVDRAIMAPALARPQPDRTSRRSTVTATEDPVAADAVAIGPSAGSGGASLDLDARWSERREILARLRQLRDAALEKSEYVGERFAEQARLVHEETTEGKPARAVHGEASRDEVLSLLDDGIPVAPIPPLPDDAN